MIKASTILQTKYGKLKINYHQFGKLFCLSFTHGNLAHNPIVRIHSSCIFSETFKTIDCDCSLQLDKSLELISKSNGVVVYLFQEGRGIGLLNKIQAMEVEKAQDIDTVEAFKFLGLPLDKRSYSTAIKALKELGVAKQIKLITNNPRKRNQVKDAGFVISENVKLTYHVNTLIKRYLDVKRTKLGHDI